MSSQPTLEPVRQIAAHELVVDQMRRALERGQFRPGDHLPSERDMAEMLDVSRTVVRAAVAVLEREGRISVRRGRGGGFLVLPPVEDPEIARRALRENRAAIRDAVEYRILIESGAARLAAERRKKSDLTHLKRLLQEMDVKLASALDHNDAHVVTEFHALDTAFHVGVARASQNSHLEDAVIDARRRMWLQTGAVFWRLEQNANDHHAEILKAIEAKDIDGAANAVACCINGTAATIQAYLKHR